MSFIQLVVAERDETPSGVSIRSKSNFEILSTLWPAKDGGRIVSLRIDKSLGLKSRARIVAPLLPQDVSELVADCRRQSPDFILVEGVILFQAIVALVDALPELVIIVDMHNIESILRAQMDRHRLPRPLQFLAPYIFYRQWRASRQVEKQAVAIARQIWVCSGADAMLADDFFGNRSAAIVPNPIPAWTQTVVPAPKSMSREVLFVGHLGYGPNKQAVAFLCNDVMPHLRKFVPDAVLTVCGRHPSRRITALVQSSGNRLRANVENMADVYATAAVAAIPLRDGGGTRLKVLEAMAIGCPVVATEKAVEGLGVLPDVHYRRAQTHQEFADEIADVLNFPNFAAEMADCAKLFTLTHFGSKSRVDAVRTALAAGRFL